MRKRLQDLWEIFRRPVSDEKRALLARRWEELPPELRTPWQIVGRQLPHCGYTLGPSYCSFGCTHCYLPSNANQTPMPSLETMKDEIDAHRRILGEHGALQITGGDVVDAYFRAGRGEELVEIVRYAGEVGLVPMLMTHGQRLLENPSFLERLIVHGRLRKLSVHIDTTQAGRPGFPLRELRSEADLHPLRQQFVDLIHAARRATGTRFSVAQTVTVTAKNIDTIDEILKWTLAEKNRVQALGMISFQPEADVGRTRFSANPASPEACWSKICGALGTDLQKDHLWFGHPDCSHWITLAVLYPEGRVINLFSGDEESRRFWNEVFETWGGIGSRGHDHLRANLQRFSMLLRRPAVLGESGRFLRHVLARERLSWTRLLTYLPGRNIATLNIVQHNFMDAEQIRSDSEIVRQRLAACSFRGAVRGEEGWEAVPMCAMNTDQRRDLYARKIQEAAP